jgi:LPXTG-site transpeptidase (sortase) family protein
MRLGVGLLAGAGALAVFAVGIHDPAPEPIAFVEPVVIETSPSTVATLPSTVATPPSTVATPPSSVASPTTTPAEPRPAATLPVSPLAAQLPPRLSAIPPDTAPVAPAELWIGDLTLWAPIVPVGFEADGQLEIPGETEVGWYRFGSSPGSAGSTVLAAHVSWNDTIGPFFRLAELEPGAVIKLELTDGTSRQYQVVERAQYGKTELPAERIWTRAGDETLVLITCGGDFNRRIDRYTDNIVIYAVPVQQVS